MLMVHTLEADFTSQSKNLLSYWLCLPTRRRSRMIWDHLSREGTSSVLDRGLGKEGRCSFHKSLVNNALSVLAAPLWNLKKRYFCCFPKVVCWVQRKRTPPVFCRLTSAITFHCIQGNPFLHSMWPSWIETLNCPVHKSNKSFLQCVYYITCRIHNGEELGDSEQRPVFFFMRLWGSS